MKLFKVHGVANTDQMNVMKISKTELGKQHEVLLFDAKHPVAEEAAHPKVQEAAGPEHPLLSGFSAVPDVSKPRASRGQTGEGSGKAVKLVPPAPVGPVGPAVPGPIQIPVENNSDTESTGSEGVIEYDETIGAWTIGGKKVKMKATPKQNAAGAVTGSTSSGSGGAGATTSGGQTSAPGAHVLGVVVPAGSSSSSSSGGGAVPPPGPQPWDIPKVPPTDDPAAEADGHVFVWITRTGKVSTCTGCGKEIDKTEIKVTYDPHQSFLPKSRQWKKVLWKYYHIEVDCLRHMVAQAPWFGRARPQDPRYQTDIRTLPSRMRQSAEDFTRDVQDAKARYADRFALACQ